MTYVHGIMDGESLAMAGQHQDGSGGTLLGRSWLDKLGYEMWLVDVERNVGEEVMSCTIFRHG